MWACMVFGTYMKQKAVNIKPPMGTPDNRKHAAAENPEIRVVNKRKLLKRPEDGAYIILSESEMWTKEQNKVYIVKRSNRYQILKEVIGYRVYSGIDDTIKTGFQAKQAVSKKVTTWEVGIGDIADDGKDRRIRDNRNGLGL
ncbi:hypothetical protein G6F45_011079 [Rhizopus arrhizus]|nr:hypothetical protein G6F45_011079 [Rhizopus arrhizus]